MLSPSDFNNAVPQFTNGNYASNPINPQYIAEPDAESYNRGTEPLQTLPAQWWNWFLNKFTARFNKVNIYVKNIFNELAQVLSIFNITPDGTEQTPTTSQLKTVFETCYPQYVKNDLYGNTVGTALGTAAVGTCTTFARSDHVHPVTGLATICVDSANCPGIGVAGDYSTFVRTTEYGFVPYCIDTTNGYGYLGVNGWPFKEVHSKNFYGTLFGNVCGNASSATTVNRYSYPANDYEFDLALLDSYTCSNNATTYVGSNCRATFNTLSGVLSASSFSGTVTGTIWASQRIFSCASEVEAQLLEVLSDNYGYVTRLRMGLTPNKPGFRSAYLAIGCNDQGTAFDRFYFVQGQGGDVITSATIGSQSVACATEATCACCAQETQRLKSFHISDNQSMGTYYYYENGVTCMYSNVTILYWIDRYDVASAQILKGGKSIQIESSEVAGPDISYARLN